MRKTLAAALAVSSLSPLAAMAQTATAPTAQLPPVVVSATRSEARAFDIPASISRIGADEVQDGHALINISESLGGVPGLLARDRQNYAQDVQLSVRGFGARSTFGIRGVRLYVDGIPATLPDGQGQVTHADLGSVGRIEVLRGPFSALYGNSSGGVINVFTEDGSAPASLSFSAAAGSDGLQRFSAKAQGTADVLSYVISASRFSTDGFREHSAVERTLGNAKLTWRPDAQSKLTLVANSVTLPMAQDPLGLTRAQFGANPRGVDASALDYDTRKSVNQTQLGLSYERRLDAAHAVQLMAYGGHRGTAQFQSIPRTTQAAPLHPGGVIDLSRDYSGADLRWRWKATDGLSLIAGLAWDALDEQRRGYQNFSGTTLGVLGALRRDENNRVSSFDQYLQMNWQLAPRWTLNAGLRHSSVRFSSRDQYILGTNPDDSGSARYGATLPAAGLMFALSDEVHLYASAGRGFETPTLNELAYRAGGGTGMNFALQSAGSRSVEAGLKARIAGWGELSAAAFRTDTEREIVTQTNSGGRSTFQNAGATHRSGVELAWAGRLAKHLRLQAAATLLNATYRDAFLTCTATPCAAANVTIPAGRRIPGIARGTAFAALSWAPPTGWRAGVETRYVSGVFVNDANSDAAAGSTLTGAHLGYVWAAGPWVISGLLRADNVFDRRSIGSVIVNEGNSRFFEPAPGRTWLAGVSGTLKFW